MGTLFKPVVGEIHLFSKHIFIWMLHGEGSFETDFNPYLLKVNSLYFFTPGQYFKLLSGNPELQQQELGAEIVLQKAEAQFLFRPIVSLGHVDVVNTSATNLLELTWNNSVDDAGLLEGAIASWLLFNPFNISLDETRLLFTMKAVLDEHVYDRPNLTYLSKQINSSEQVLQLLLKKLQKTVTFLVSQKLLLELKRQIVFTDHSIKQIALNSGFKDPAHFVNFFKKFTYSTPLAFRKGFNFSPQPERDFSQALLELIEKNFSQNLTAHFYSDRLVVAEKTFQRRVHNLFGVTLHQFITTRRLREAQSLLLTSASVTEVSYRLGFKEVSHFSAFFKKYLGISPSGYKGIEENLQ